ncbi:MAG: putative peptidoglycan glycosyltransferase FtsW [Patescibacteria group bacterium]
MRGRRRTSVNTDPSRSSFSNSKFADVRGHRPDYIILFLSLLLLSVGLIVVYSISPGLAASQGVSTEHFINKQLVSVGLGLVAFTVMALTPVEIFFRLRKHIAIVAISASVLLLFVGERVNGAVRWIDLPGGISFQVAELIKISIIIGLSYELSRRMSKGTISDTNATLKPLIGLLLLVTVFVAFLQSDFGSAAVIVAIIFTQSITAGLPFKKISMVLAMILIIGVIAIASAPYRRERVKTFINPSRDCLTQNEESLGAGYQTCQALIALGSGGIFGLGVGNSIQAYGYLPEAENDSIFAIIGEKFGFFGVSLIITLYLFLFSRFKLMINRLNNNEYKLLVVGVLTWLATQTIINVGAMAGLLPLKGITLPLVSYGGTSLLFVMIGLGMVFRLSRFTAFRDIMVSDEKSNNTISRRR